MSEQKKKAMGRGRGKVVPKAEGPWSRSKKVEEAINTNKNQEDVKTRPDGISTDQPKQNKFELSPMNFPPLPGSSSTDSDLKPTTDGNQQTKEERIISNIDSHKTIQNESAAYEGLVDKVETLKIDKEESMPISPILNIDKETNTLHSRLNPQARVFVPQAPVIAIPSQDQSAQEFVSNTAHSELDNQDSLSENNHNYVDNFYLLLANVEEIVNFCYVKICESPGFFDELMVVMKSHFETLLRHRDIITKTVEIYYNYAATDTTFSYHAVRSLIYLDSISFEEHHEHHLRNDTLTLAKKKNTEVHNLLMTPEVNFNDVFPSLLFLSELFIHLEVGSKRLSFLGTAIVDTLRKLLAAEALPIKERLSITVSVVKLTGTFLDEEPQEGLNTLMEELDTKLIKEKPYLDRNTILMVENLIRLRSNNWGEGQNENLNNSGTNQLTNGNLETVIPMEDGQVRFLMEMADEGSMDDNTVFYGPDGNVMLYEEQMFLEQGYIYEEEVEEDGSELSPGSMDGDMQSAYEEFLLTIPAQQNH